MIFRFRNGSAVVQTDMNMKSMGINVDYYSKESIMMATHSSFILPRESPLVVSILIKKALKIDEDISPSCNTGLVFFLDYVAEGHRNFEQAEV